MYLHMYENTYGIQNMTVLDYPKYYNTLNYSLRLT